MGSTRHLVFSGDRREYRPWSIQFLAAMENFKPVSQLQLIFEGPGKPTLTQDTHDSDSNAEEESDSGRKTKPKKEKKKHAAPDESTSQSLSPKEWDTLNHAAFNILLIYLSGQALSLVTNSVSTANLLRDGRAAWNLLRVTYGAPKGAAMFETVSNSTI